VTIRLLFFSCPTSVLHVVSSPVIPCVCVLQTGRRVFIDRQSRHMREVTCLCLLEQGPGRNAIVVSGSNDCKMFAWKFVVRGDHLRYATEEIV
jgi:hypothetical protein